MHLAQISKNGIVISAVIIILLGNSKINGQSNLSLAEQYLETNYKSQNLSEKDISEWIETDNYISNHNNVHHIYLQQTYNGVPVENAIMNFNIADNDKVLSVHSRFVPGLKDKVSGNKRISSLQAVKESFKALNINIPIRLELLNRNRNKRSYTKYRKFENIDSDIISQLTYIQESPDKFVLAWEVEIHTIKPKFNAWKMFIDATTGEILKKLNMVLECSFSNAENKCSEETHEGLCTEDLNNKKDDEEYHKDLISGDSYLVYAYPNESPNHGGRSIVVDPADPTASPFGWHDTNGAQGAEFTTTRGNNVWVQEDINGNNSTGFSPDGGAMLDFHFDVDFSLPPDYNISPGQNLQSSLTNLFYWNNIVHDVCYHYGFDEVSGNFQINNYGRGGLENDHILADGLDGISSNNARFYSSPDGAVSRMEMYLWSDGGPFVTSAFNVNSPNTIAGSYIHATANFGQKIYNVTGNLVIADDGTPNGSQACNPLINGAAINGNIALIDRGGCEFGLKVLNAQNAGAIAAVVCNNIDGSTFGMGPGLVGDSVSIPAIMISQNDCNTIRMEIPTVEVTLTETLNPTLYDGSFDNGIIAHEYAHGVSNRLTGGPGTVSCLNNLEQGGEGWSDFFFLVFTHGSGDTRNTPRGFGTYAKGQEISGLGLRTHPYTSDMNINPLTYDDIKTQSIPHGVGSVLCSMLWDMYWDFVDLYGYDPNIYSGTGGNNMAFQLVMDGMKLQPCNPGFIDVRDAILLADEINNGGANRCLIWNAFAKRGLGLSADQGSPDDRSDGIEAFDLPDDLKMSESITAFDAYEGEILNIVASVTCGCTEKINVEYKHTIPEGFSVMSVVEGDHMGNEISKTIPTLNAGSTLDIEYMARIELCNPETETIMAQEGAESSYEFLSNTIGAFGNWMISSSESYSGTNSWYAENHPLSSDYGLSLITPINISGPTVLEFYHKYETEATWDGGIVEVFSNGVWSSLEDNFIMNGYPATLAPISSTPLAGQKAFTGKSSSQLGVGFIKSVIDLSHFNGEAINIRFRFVTDNNTQGSGLNGWYIDDIKIRQIPAVEIISVVSSDAVLQDSKNHLIEIKDLNQDKVYVDEKSTGARYGGNWENAFQSLQNASEIAACNPFITEIWVKEGDYYPTEGMDKTKSFELIEGVAIYGGFNGTESMLNQRDVNAHVTTLSGNIGNPGDKMDNSQTVVKAENVNSTAVLDGFVIKDGYSDTNEGVGLANYNSSATIRRCTFINNYSGLNGGAVSNENGSSSVFSDCVFIDNSCEGQGGAINNKGSSNIILQDCFFNSNTCNSGIGRTINNHHSTMTLNNVIIIDSLLNTDFNTVHNQGEGSTITVYGSTGIKKN